MCIKRKCLNLRSDFCKVNWSKIYLGCCACPKRFQNSIPCLQWSRVSRRRLVSRLQLHIKSPSKQQHKNIPAIGPLAPQSSMNQDEDRKFQRSEPFHFRHNHRWRICKKWYHILMDWPYIPAYCGQTLCNMFNQWKFYNSHLGISVCLQAP